MFRKASGKGPAGRAPGRVRVLGALGALVVFLPACSGLLPRAHVETVSTWSDFATAKSAFDSVVPGETTMAQLHDAGFHPLRAPNVRLLNYLDVTRIFLPNPSITLSDIDPAVRECLAEQESCGAYELDLSVLDRERYGNVLLDMFGFRKYARESGWAFRALIVLNGDQVVHKQWSGQPIIERVETKDTPLGPIQEIDLGSALRTVR